MKKHTIDVEFDLEKKKFALELRRRVIGCEYEICQITIPEYLVILACKKTCPKIKTDEEAIDEIKSLYLDVGYDTFVDSGCPVNIAALDELGREFDDIALEFMGYGESKNDIYIEPILMYPFNRIELILYKHTRLEHEFNNSDYPYKFAVRTF